MELGCRGYMEEPAMVDATNWPTPFDETRANVTSKTLRRVIEALREACAS